MRLTLALAGWTLDWSLEPTSDVAEDDEPTDSGYTASTFLGFVAAHDLPDEAAIHRPRSPWEDDSEAKRGDL